MSNINIVVDSLNLMKKKDFRTKGQKIYGKIVIVKCEKCGREIFVDENFIRPRMFCTLGCMDSYIEECKT
jgi:uncharacterized OB-fold protein